MHFIVITTCGQMGRGEGWRQWDGVLRGTVAVLCPLPTEKVVIFQVKHAGFYALLVQYHLVVARNRDQGELSRPPWGLKM